MEGAPGDVWGQHGVVEISRKNVDNGASSYPGESEGKKRINDLWDLFFFHSFPEMPNHGASYPSREWNISVDGFGLLQWQPAPLLNTLWKQFLLCNAGENQQIINLSQYSPSARKYKSLPCGCKGKPFPSLKNGWCLIIASDVSSHLGLQFGVTLIFSTLEVGVPAPTGQEFRVEVQPSGGGREFPQLCFILPTVLQLHANKCIFVRNSKKLYWIVLIVRFCWQNSKATKTQLVKTTSLQALPSTPSTAALQVACAPRLSSQSTSFYASSPEHFAPVCPIAYFLCSSLTWSSQPLTNKNRENNSSQKSCYKRNESSVGRQGAKWTFSNHILTL